MPIIRPAHPLADRLLKPGFLSGFPESGRFMFPNKLMVIPAGPRITEGLGWSGALPLPPQKRATSATMARALDKEEWYSGFPTGPLPSSPMVFKVVR
jgi:hypothetical protein